jgi:hypothetical protein
MAKRAEKVVVPKPRRPLPAPEGGHYKGPTGESDLPEFDQDAWERGVAEANAAAIIDGP